MTHSTTVAHTNDSSTGSKASMAHLGYFYDPCISWFVDKVPRRSAIINRGYFARVYTVDYLVNTFLNFSNKSTPQNAEVLQIVSLGSGFDSLFFRLKASLSPPMAAAKFIEVDFPQVIKRKMQILKNNQKCTFYEKCSNVFVVDNQSNQNAHILIGCDLGDLDQLSIALHSIPLDFRYPTFLLAECVLNYLPVAKADSLLRWLNANFSNAILAAYEQIEPNDAFGRFMLQHFLTIQSPLRCIQNYASVSAERQRMTNLGWRHVTCVDLNKFYYTFLERSRRAEISKLEPFDEFEPWHLKCAHYCIVVAQSGGDSSTVSHLMSEFNRLLFDHDSADDSDGAGLHDFAPKLCVQETVEWHAAEILEKCAFCPPVTRFAHSATAFFATNHSTADHPLLKMMLLGGWAATTSSRNVGMQSRCGNVVSLQRSSSLSNRASWVAETVSIKAADDDDFSSTADLQLDRMHHVVVPISQSAALLIGGRRSPSHPCNPVLLHLEFKPQIDDNDCLYLKISKFTPVELGRAQSFTIFPRWRHAATSISVDGRDNTCVFVCGGLTTTAVDSSSCRQVQQVLADCYIIDCDTRSIKRVADLPMPLHSHSACYSPRHQKIYVSGGLNEIDSSVSSQCYVFNTLTCRWAAPLSIEIARYSHTSHLIDDQLILIGGVNNNGSEACKVPPITVLELSNTTFTARHIDQQRSTDNGNAVLLVNHDSVIDENSGKLIIFGGGANCFSFGTLFNPPIVELDLCNLNIFQ